MEKYAHFLLTHHCCAVAQPKMDSRNRSNEDHWLRTTRTANVAADNRTKCIAYSIHSTMYTMRECIYGRFIFVIFIFIFRLLISFVFRCTHCIGFIAIHFGSIFVYPNSWKSSLIFLSLLFEFRHIRWCIRVRTAHHIQSHAGTQARIHTDRAHKCTMKCNRDTKPTKHHHRLSDGNKRKRWKCRRRAVFDALTNTTEKKNAKKNRKICGVRFGQGHK